MSDQTEDFEMAWQRLEYATEEHAKILVINADLRKRIAELEAENERRLGQLPDSMKDCTIRYIECDIGHGRLKAENWVDPEWPCPSCYIAKLEAENERLRSLLNRAKPYIEAYEEATGESIEQILSAIDAAMEGN